MASWFIGANRGVIEQQGRLTVGTSTGSVDIELRIDTGKGSTKEDVIKALRNIEYYILANGVPGGTGVGVDLPPL